jgi:hypothetical protein
MHKQTKNPVDVLRWLAKRHGDEQRDALARLAKKWGAL